MLYHHSLLHIIQPYIKEQILISHETQQSQSQWSELRGTYIEFRNQLIITTSKFTENYINEENSNRLNFIYKLYERGFSNREITDVLNIYGIKKSRTKTHYTVNDVYMCLKKLKIRKQRLSEMDCILGEWSIFEYKVKNN